MAFRGSREFLRARMREKLTLSRLVVWASAFACSGNFLLRFAGCQGKDLIAERRRATLASRFSGCSALAPPSSRWSSLSFRGRHFS